VVRAIKALGAPPDREGGVVSSDAVVTAVRTATQGLDGNARIAPHALTQLAGAIDDRFGRDITARLFFTAGLTTRLAHPPEVSVPARELACLHAVMEQGWGQAVAGEVAADAGRRLADILIATKVPRAALHPPSYLPAEVIAIHLVRWLRARGADSVGIQIVHARVWPGRVDLWLSDALQDTVSCAARRALLTRLFARLVHPQVHVSSHDCDGECYYRLTLRGG